MPAPAASKDVLHDNHVERPNHSGSDSSDDSASSASDVVREVVPPVRNPAPAASSAPKSPDVSAMELHDDEIKLPTCPPMAAASTTQAEGSAPDPAPPQQPEDPPVDNRICCQCGQPMGSTKGATTRDGPLHPHCIAEYKFLHQPRCRYCHIRFRDDEIHTFVKDSATGYLYHPDCHACVAAGKPYVQPTKEGEVRKFAIARKKISRHNWKSRYFVLSPANGGIRYYVDKAAATAGGGGGGDKKGSDDSSYGSGSYDRDADPDREANDAKRAKGVVPLNNRSRLLTRPAMSNYKVSSSSATANDIGIIFFESPESQKELRLIFQCGSLEERDAWIRALEAYIYTVDDPADYTNARAATRAKEKRVKEKAEKKDAERKEAKK